MWAGYSEMTRELVITKVLARDNTSKWNFSNLRRPLYRDKDPRKKAMKLGSGQVYMA